MPATKFLTIDIGKAWTKAFLISQDQKGNLQIEKSAKLPTTHGDLSIGVKALISSLVQPEAKTLIVSRLKEAGQLAKNLKIEFVHEDDASKVLVEYFKKPNQQISILDAGASHLQAKIETKEIGKFLSFAMSEVALENFLGNKSFRPHTIAVNPKELEIEEAFYRNLFTSSLANISADEKLLLIVSGGVISGTPNIYRLAYLILDTLANGQLAQVYFDREFFLPSFGALLFKYSQLKAADPGIWLDNLGAFASLGSPRSVELDWGYSLQQKVQLTEGEIALIPVPVDQNINLSFELQKKKQSFGVSGGSLGLLMDAREKPLMLSFGQEESRKNVASWLKQIEESQLAEEAF